MYALETVGKEYLSNQEQEQTNDAEDNCWTAQLLFDRIINKKAERYCQNDVGRCHKEHKGDKLRDVLRLENGPAKVKYHVL